MTPAKLQALIAASGLSRRRFATEVMSRDERTVRRWVSGEIVIPPVASEWLSRLISVRESKGRLTITLRG